MGSLFRLLGAAALMMVVAGSALAQSPIFLRIGTGGAGGTYFPIGGTIASGISAPPGARPCADGGQCGVPGLIAIAQSTTASVFNNIPMLQPLYDATCMAVVQGRAYVLSSRGQPYASPDSLGSRFHGWCHQAGLQNRSAHGVRKAAGNLLAETGATQHGIMAVLGHIEAKTSEIYTKDAKRWEMAASILPVMNALEW